MVAIANETAVKNAVEFYSRSRYTKGKKGAETKNGRGRYAIVDMQDYERTQATLRLMNELAKGRKSGEEKGWLTLEAVEKHLGIADE